MTKKTKSEPKKDQKMDYNWTKNRQSAIKMYKYTK